MKNTLVQTMAVMIFLLCGCASNHNQKFILHDTVYDDYYHHGKWYVEKSKADQMTYSEANRWLTDFRLNERGEYANTGSKNYPIKIEPTTNH